MAAVNTKFTGDASQLEAAAIKAANAIHETTNRIQEQAHTVTSSAASYTEGLAQTAANANQRLESLARGLDATSTAVALTAAGFDAMRLPVVSDRLANLSGRIEEVNGFVKMAAMGAEVVADNFGTASMVAADYSRRLEGTAKAAEAAARAQIEVAEKARESEISWGTWIVVALGAAAVATTVYGVVAAIGMLTGAISEAADAVENYVSEITGASALQQQFTAEAMSSAEAITDLNRELGIGAANLAQLGAVSQDYQVSSAQAESVMRRLVDVIQDNNDKTKEARDVLDAYGISVKSLSGADWAVVLDRFAKAMNETKDSTQKTRDAIAVLGTDGTTWLKGIADGAGKISHSATEAERIYSVVSANIVESQKKIAAGPGVAWYDFWSEPLKRFDQLITRSDEFKAKQVYALSHASIAWKEYEADVTSAIDAWHGVTRSAEEYFRLLISYTSFKDEFEPLVVPAIVDSRPPSPVPNAQSKKEVSERKFSDDTAVRDYEEQLEDKKRLQENWLSWSLEKEREFWKSAKAEWIAAHETMAPEQLSGNKTVKAFDNKIADIGRSLEQRDDKTAGDGIVEKWRNQLEQMKSEQGRWFSWSKGEEISYWQDRLNQVSKGSREYTQIEKELFNLKRETSREEFEVELSYMRLAQEAEKGSAESQLQISKVIAGRIADTYGERSQRHHQALQDIERAERAHAEQVKRINQMAVEAHVAAANDNFDLEREKLGFAQEMGQISAVEEIQRLRNLEEQKFQVERQAARKKAELVKDDVEAHKRAQMDIERSERQHNTRMVQLANQQAIAKRNAIREWTNPIKDAVNQMTNGIAQGTLKADQLVTTFLSGMVSKYAAKLGEMAMEWMETHILMALFSEQTAAQELAIETASSVAAIAASKAQAIGEISSAAGVGAAWAMASVAAIPIIGWAMAPAVGAAHFATAMSYMAAVAVPAAEKGWWEVPADTLAVIHKEEMVMPGHLAGAVRRAVEGGSVNDNAPAQQVQPVMPVNFHIHALDGASVARVLRSQGPLLAEIVHQRQRFFQKGRK